MESGALGTSVQTVLRRHVRSGEAHTHAHERGSRTDQEPEAPTGQDRTRASIK